MSLTDDHIIAEPGGDDSLHPDRAAIREDYRERSIPLRLSDVVNLLLVDNSLEPEDRERWRRLTSVLSATFHHEMHAILNDLKDLYSPLDPDDEAIRIPGVSRVRTTASDELFLREFEETLVRANFRSLDIEFIERAIEAPNESGLNYVPNLGMFEHLKVYVRGAGSFRRVVRNLATRFRRREILLDGYRRLVVILKFRENDKLGEYARSDVLYLRLFKDVPHVDMEMHLPEQGTRVRMRLVDKAQIASPLVTGLPMVAYKLMMGGLAAFLVGSTASFGIIVAPFSAGINSFFGFQRAKQRHLHRMIRHLYYLTLANNSGVITRIVDAAEEEEVKEALLAYFLLAREAGPEGWTSATIDARVEAFLHERTGADIDFEIRDALDKLVRLGMVRFDGTRYRAVSVDDALVALDRRWDEVFRFANPEC